MAPIVFNNPPLSFEEYRSLNLKYIWKSQKSRLVVAPIFIIIIGVNTFNTSQSPSGIRDNFGLVMLSVFIFLFLILIYFKYNSAFKKNYNNTPILKEQSTVTLAEQTIALRSKSTISESPWPASFKKAVRINHWLLLSSGAATAYFLDINEIEFPATLADVEALLQQKGIVVK